MSSGSAGSAAMRRFAFCRGVSSDAAEELEELAGSDAADDSEDALEDELSEDADAEDELDASDDEDDEDEFEGSAALELLSGSDAALDADSPDEPDEASGSSGSSGPSEFWFSPDAAEPEDGFSPDALDETAEPEVGSSSA